MASTAEISSKPIKPILDDDDDLTKRIDIDINAVVDTMWKGRSQAPIVPQCEANEVLDAFIANINQKDEESKNPRTIPPPMAGKEISTVVDETVDIISKFSRRIAHPGHFGFIAASGVPTDPLAFAMTAAVNMNVATFMSSPVMATMERTVISWLCQMIGFDETIGDGCLLSGGSSSNLTAVGTAMAHKFGADYREKGLAKSLKPGEQPVLICSGATHFCVQRAAGMLGIGVDNVIPIGGDENFCMRMDLLKQAIEENPCVVCVVANAGSTTTGAVDPIDKIADLCAAHNIWLHVDAAYGGSALMSPELAPIFKGIARADSVTMDLHKWFFMSYDCSAIVYKDPATVKTLFDEKSDVVKQLSLDTFSSSHLFFHLGPELSRRARALPVYIAFQHYGMKRLGNNVLYHVQCTNYLGECVEYDPDLVLVTAPSLSICTFRMVPSGLLTNDKDEDKPMIDALNKHIFGRIEKEGNYFISPTKVEGRPVLRACLVNHYSRVTDVDGLLETIKRVGKEWIDQNSPLSTTMDKMSLNGHTNSN